MSDDLSPDDAEIEASRAPFDNFRGEGRVRDVEWVDDEGFVSLSALACVRFV